MLRVLLVQRCTATLQCRSTGHVNESIARGWVTNTCTTKQRWNGLLCLRHKLRGNHYIVAIYRRQPPPLVVPLWCGTPFLPRWRNWRVRRLRAFFRKPVKRKFRMGLWIYPFQGFHKDKWCYVLERGGWLVPSYRYQKGIKNALKCYLCSTMEKNRAFNGIIGTGKDRVM